jgi:hypothetical protein
MRIRVAIGWLVRRDRLRCQPPQLKSIHGTLLFVACILSMILVEVMAVYGRLNDARNALALARADVYADSTQQDSRTPAELPGSNIPIGRFNVVCTTIYQT